jgi:hypothetical protein
MKHGTPSQANRGPKNPGRSTERLRQVFGGANFSNNIHWRSPFLEQIGRCNAPFASQETHSRQLFR